MYCKVSVRSKPLSLITKCKTVKIYVKLFQRNVIAVVIFISEDILRSDNAIWISPDGKKVVYATFNDSKVTNVKWKMFGNGMDASVNPYPREAFMRYPKVKKRS